MREKNKRIEAALAEYAKHAPPIDYRASFDSLDLMEGVMRHFYLLALIEQRQGADADWEKVNSLMRQVLVAAEKVARYRHAQIAAIRLSGDVNAKVDESTIEELLVKIKEEYKELGPLLDLDVVGEAQGSRTKRPWPRTASSHAVKHG
jgi:hypothetical protein